jgi:hypothetical protein
MSAADRLARFGVVATWLALLSDTELERRLDGSASLGSGIGGKSRLLDVDGTPVFVKRIPLTDLERRPDNVMSTANLFQLPPFYQYGVGSTGFGVWRELAAHTITTNWVVAGRSEGFPLMYHWRALPEPAMPPPTPEQRAERDRAVAYWDGSTAVCERLNALAHASASIVLFLEHVPYTLAAWLTDQLAAGDARAQRAIAMVDRWLGADVAWMNANGLFHFDAHFENLLTDGRRLYFADLGLATSPRFVLSDPEVAFLARNRTYDASYTATHLVNWLVRTLTGTDDRDGLIRRYSQGDDPAGVGTSAAAIIKRDGPIALVMNEFYRMLQRESRTTEYPAEKVRKATAVIP